MGNLFGKKKVSRVTEHDKAVLVLIVEMASKHKDGSSKGCLGYILHTFLYSVFDTELSEEIAYGSSGANEQSNDINVLELQVKQQRDKVKQYQQRVETKLESDRQLAKKLLQSGQRDRAKLLLKKKRYQESLLERTEGQMENLEKIIQDLEFAQVELKVVEGLKFGNEALKKLNDVLNIDEIERIMEETNEGVEKQEEINRLLSGNLSVEDLEEVEREYNELLDMEAEALKLPDVPPHEPLKIKDATPKEAKKEKIAMEAS